MLSSFEEDSELCMKAGCALYRHQTFEGNSANGMFHYYLHSDADGNTEFLRKCNCWGEMLQFLRRKSRVTTVEVDAGVIKGGWVQFRSTLCTFRFHFHFVRIHHVNNKESNLDGFSGF